MSKVCDVMNEAKRRREHGPQWGWGMLDGGPPIQSVPSATPAYLTPDQVWVKGKRKKRTHEVPCRKMMVTKLKRKLMRKPGRNMQVGKKPWELRYFFFVSHQLSSYEKSSTTIGPAPLEIKPNLIATGYNAQGSSAERC